ncbi:MAG TPA: hypothetical protein VEG30_05875 [Terriglobales bacterium]|nr:hypothetical protein [Terriglobales bacterium]
MPQVDFGENIGKPIAKRVRVNLSAARKVMLMLAISVCAALSACSSVVTIWSAEAGSPDGRWVATARTDQYSGPGNAALLTTVHLRRTNGPKDPIEVLLFMQDAKSIDLKMTWSTPSHLEVTYKQPAVIDFQAIKCGGVDISVRDVSSSTMNSSH